MSDTLALLKRHQTGLRKCSACEKMHGKPVVGQAALSPVLLIGQAPGDKEVIIHKPFAWTAGKTLFKWFNQIGMDEENFRQRVYMAAVCRCFPGKNPTGGDRVPDEKEISSCSKWLGKEVSILQPRLVIPVGKLAISQLAKIKKLDEVIGKKIKVEVYGYKTDIIPLPHPSGASTWHRKEPGIGLLKQALGKIRLHPAWKQLLTEVPE